MYINEVVEDVRRVLPSEYTTKELYRWCDELSAYLMREYKKCYKRVTLTAENGCFFLPDDVAEVESVIADGKEIPERDLRTMGFAKEFTSDGYVLCDINEKPKGTLTVNYLVSYSPIRFLDETVSITGLSDSGENHMIVLSDTLGIIPGDTLDISGTVVHTVEVSGDGLTLTYKGDKVADDGEVKSVRIKRHITDSTICPSPYDTMYIDFCTMKIAWYQRNYNVYNYMKKAFSDKLESYAKYLRRNAAVEPVTKIINYMT